jgi:hypothetical protein
MDTKVCFRASNWLILLFIVIVTLTLFSSNGGIAQKADKFASAQTQTSDAAIDLKVHKHRLVMRLLILKAY